MRDYKILVIGKDGQVGWELQRSLATLGRVLAPSRDVLDLGRPGELPRAIAQTDPDLIVNAAAYTAVDRAEDDVETAYLINATAVERLAAQAAERGIYLVHYSTDYVFDGRSKDPYGETDRTGPISVYGSSKLAGENYIQASGAPHIILRTSWVYAARRRNFLKAILEAARDGRPLRVVDDQIGAPTGSELIADATTQIVQRLMREGTSASTLQGVYHLTASGYANRFELARYILEQAAACGATLQNSFSHIEPVSTSEVPARAARPLNSRLITDKLTSTFDIYLPDWRDGVARTVHEIISGGPV